jgi:leader peptidase (prepilin peptidase) / N-methyltransferase
MGAGVVGVCALAWLAALSIYDVRQRRLPNALTLPGAIVVLIVATLAGRGTPALVGGLALFAVYLLMHLLATAAMGAGDVKLAIGVGALTGSFGVDVWVLAALAAPLLTAVWAIILAIRKTGWTVPHGPSMCLASGAAVAVALL